MMDKKDKFLVDMTSDAEDLLSDLSDIRDIFSILLDVFRECKDDPYIQSYAGVAGAAIYFTDDCIRRANDMAKAQFDLPPSEHCPKCGERYQQHTNVEVRREIIRDAEG